MEGDVVHSMSDGVAVINMSQAQTTLQSRSIEVNSDIVQLYDFDAIVSFLQVFVEQSSSS